MSSCTVAPTTAVNTALQATPEGIAWLEAQERAKEAKRARTFARYTADALRRTVDEHLIASQMATNRLMEWRLLVQLGRTAEARQAKELADAATAHYENTVRSITNHDAWRAVSRREAHLHRVSRETTPAQPAGQP